MNTSILGVRVDRISASQLTEKCRLWLSYQELQQVVTVNPEFVMEAQRNSEFRDILNNAACAIADGIGLFFASWFLYGWKRRLFRVTGVDFIWLLAKLCSEKGARMYLLGSGKGIAEKAAKKLKDAFPALLIVGAEEGISKNEFRISNFELPMRDQKFEDEEICRRIIASGADVLLVAFGAPKQDLWIAKHAHLLEGVKIAVGVGGTFDYLADSVSHAPRWVRAIGFEWIYRLMTQPYRWRRIVTAVVLFPLTVLRAKFFGRKNI